MHTYLFMDSVFWYVSGVVQPVIYYFTVDMNYSDAEDIQIRLLRRWWLKVKFTMDMYVLRLFKGVLCGFGLEIQAQNFNI